VTNQPINDETPAPAMMAYFLDRLPFERCLELQRRLLVEVGDRDDGQIVLLLCEHPNLITIGRGGSPAGIRQDSSALRSREIETIYVNRGGGCLLHCPGQLAIYPIVPLHWHGFTVGEFVERLQAGIIEALDDLNVPTRTAPGRHGVWGRTGQLAAIGVAVRNWVTYFGAYLNVDPSLGLFRLVDVDTHQPSPLAPTTSWCPPINLRSVPGEGSPATQRCVQHTSSLMAERRGSIKLTMVRAALVGRLSEAFGCDRYHLFTGHPYLRGEG
jgi:lipoyl(octanoyl) transferase